MFDSRSFAFEIHDIKAVMMFVLQDSMDLQLRSTLLQ